MQHERVTFDMANGEQLKFDIPPGKLPPRYSHAIRKHCLDRETHVIGVRAWPSESESEDRNQWAIDRGINVVVSAEEPPQEELPQKEAPAEETTPEPVAPAEPEPVVEEKAPEPEPKKPAKKTAAKKKTTAKTQPEPAPEAKDDDEDALI